MAMDSVVDNFIILRESQKVFGLNPITYLRNDARLIRIEVS